MNHVTRSGKGYKLAEKKTNKAIEKEEGEKEETVEVQEEDLVLE